MNPQGREDTCRHQGFGLGPYDLGGPEPGELVEES
ncbi:mCG1048572 [Mus musculus]|nr:mCG1048572 [Mus musculus]